MKQKPFALWISAGSLLLLAGAAGVFQWFWTGPAGTVAGAELTVDILPGWGTAAIGAHLQAAGIVRSGRMFRYYAIATGLARHLKAGEYRFLPKSTLSQVVGHLASGQTARHKFLVPEGFTGRQIADKLAAEGLGDAEVFLEAVGNSRAAREWGIPAENLEGFLFPDTYDLTKGMSPRQVAGMMVKRFRKKVSPELIAAAARQGLNEREFVTLASIIEREVKVAEERSKAASVFYNRMAKRMRLESCATVQYALGRAGGALSLEDLETRSPYNTYRHAGLPPGPISNPGLSSLQAAAHPAQTDYLFFVVRPDGQHVFSRDFETHKQAKRTQKRARRNGAEDKPSSQP